MNRKQHEMFRNSFSHLVYFFPLRPCPHSDFFSTVLFFSVRCGLGQLPFFYMRSLLRRRNRNLICSNPKWLYRRSSCFPGSINICSKVHLQKLDLFGLSHSSMHHVGTVVLKSLLQTETISFYKWMMVFYKWMMVFYTEKNLTLNECWKTFLCRIV